VQNFLIICMIFFKNYKLEYSKEILIHVIHYKMQGFYKIIFYCSSRKIILFLKDIFVITHDYSTRTLFFTVNLQYKNIALIKLLWTSYKVLLTNTLKDFIFGYEIILEVRGVGYKIYVEKNILILSLGFSHLLHYEIPQDIEIKILDFKNTIFSIKGFNRSAVHEVAAKIREYKKPEPYKGKGICYINEIVILKESKKNK